MKPKTFNQVLGKKKNGYIQYGIEVNKQSSVQKPDKAKIQGGK